MLPYSPLSRATMLPESLPLLNWNIQKVMPLKKVRQMLLANTLLFSFPFPPYKVLLMVAIWMSVIGYSMDAVSRFTA